MKIKVFLILLLLVLFTNFSIAQNTLNNLSLTSSTPASVAYSLRLLSSSYPGPLVRIKVGALFYDVYPDATNKFSLTSNISASVSTYNAALASAGVNALSTIITGSTDATVAIWYDQSGNNKNAASSSPGAKIIISGSIKRLGLYGNPTIDFTGNLSLLRSTSTVNYSAQTGATVNAIAQNTNTSFGGIIGTGYTSFPGYNISYNSGQGYISDGDGGFYESGVISTDPKLITSIFTNKTQNLSKIYVNSILTTNITGSAPAYPLNNNSNSVICIGVTRENTNQFVFKGNISEAIIFPKQLTAGEQSLLETNQNAFYFSSSVSISSSVSNTICSGTNVTFTSDINNFTNTPSYQWYKNGTAINGATSSTYSSTTLSNNDQINVIATPGYSGTGVSSNIITTTVAAPSVTVTSSASGAICAGTAITFTATVCGISTPTYQWYKNGVAINGATASTYTTNSLTNNDVIKASAGDVIVSNGLIQNLDANNASSYTSGNTWNDITGNGNNGTINTLSTGSVTIANEGNIKSFNYTKGLSYISAPLSKSASMTFNIWAKTSNLTNYNTPGTMLFNAGASGRSVDGGPDLFITSNKIFWNTYDAAGNPFKLNGTDITTTTASINDNNWHNFTVVDNAVDNTASLYIDGVLKGVAVYKAPDAFSSTALFIGGEGNNAGATLYNLGWEGNISIFNSYNRALSTNEVVQNFNSKAAFYSASSSALITSNTIIISVSSITPSITITGDGCIHKTTLTTSTGLSSYQWIKDNQAILGATSNTYTPSTNGDYQVQVSNGTCSNISSATTIYTCAVDAFGKSVATSNVNSIISTEGGANFGTGRDISGKLYNTIGLTTTSGTIGSTTAILGGVISPTNVKNTSIGLLYSTDFNFGTYSSTTIQSNVAAGTYTVTITGLSGLTTYFAKSFVINKAGTSYSSVVSFTTSTPPKAVGDSYGGGKIFYILKSGDAGYDANIQHGLIAATSDQSPGNVPWSINTNYTSAIAQNIGSGLDNTTKIISSQGSGTYAAKIARDYVANSYSDWYLPSYFELKELIAQKSIIGSFNAAWYWSSSESNNGYNGSTAPYAWIQSITNPNPNEAGKPYNGSTAVRPIRSF